jgi:hypothetical protein
VYHSLLRQLGDRGCLLRGNEIVEALNNPMLKYGFSSSHEQDGYMHVDIFEAVGERQCLKGPFREGWYDGTGRVTVNSVVESDLRRRYRDVDAADYF